MIREIDSSLVDTCYKYIEEKDASYLAKEGMIVFWYSTTGRATDFLWQKHTIAETLRIIRATRLKYPLAKRLGEHHLITAFQELDRVYEFGTKNKSTTVRRVFNYSEQSGISPEDEAMSLFVDTLQFQGVKAVLLRDLVDALYEINQKLSLKLAPTELKNLMHKHFEAAGYVFKVGAHRPQVQGKKQQAVMMKQCKPSDIELDIDFSKTIEKVYGELIR